MPGSWSGMTFSDPGNADVLVVEVMGLTHQLAGMRFETALGNMTVTETLLDFDGPHLLSCHDAAGHRYVAHWVQELADRDRWFLVPVSPERLVAIRIGEIDLRTSVSRPESGWLWDITVLHDGRQGHAAQRAADSVDECELPGPNARLQLRGDPPS